MIVFFVGAITIGSWAVRLITGTGTAPFGLGALAAAAAALVVAAAFVTAMRRVGVPFTEVVSAAGRVADGDYSVRIAEHGSMSLRSVARAFNSMTAQLQAQDAQRRDLIADIAHELRTPLSVMQGQIEALIDGVYPRDDERLKDVLDETRLLARLVDDLGTLAHAERGTLALAKEPTDLGALARDTAAGLAPEAAARQVVIDVADAGPLPAADVDPVRIRQVLINLVSNAIRHSKSGGRVSITLTDRPEAIAVAVADTGEGIEADALPRIFDRFYKGAGSHGSGLGLTIARKLVEAHGGTIAADSRVGRGTTMIFTVPHGVA